MQIQALGALFPFLALEKLWKDVRATMLIILQSTKSLSCIVRGVVHYYNICIITYNPLGMYKNMFIGKQNFERQTWRGKYKQLDSGSVLGVLPFFSYIDDTEVLGQIRHVPITKRLLKVSFNDEWFKDWDLMSCWACMRYSLPRSHAR